MKLEEVLTESAIQAIKQKMSKLINGIKGFLTDPAEYNKVLDHFDQRLARLDSLKGSPDYYRELLDIEREMSQTYSNVANHQPS